MDVSRNLMNLNVIEDNVGLCILLKTSLFFLSPQSLFISVFVHLHQIKFMVQHKWRIAMLEYTLSGENLALTTYIFKIHVKNSFSSNVYLSE